MRVGTFERLVMRLAEKYDGCPVVEDRFVEPSIENMGLDSISFSKTYKVSHGGTVEFGTVYETDGNDYGIDGKKFMATSGAYLFITYYSDGLINKTYHISFDAETGKVYSKINCPRNTDMAQIKKNKKSSIENGLDAFFNAVYG